MFGYGRGWHRGRGFWRVSIEAPEGYEYIGPCRCGFGPDAYYREKKTGRIFHASQLHSYFSPYRYEDEEIRTQLEKLRREKENLERRIEELEKIFKERGE
jgi:hypothetical protein